MHKHSLQLLHSICRRFFVKLPFFPLRACVSHHHVSCDFLILAPPCLFFFFFLHTFIFSISMLPLTPRVPGAGRAAFSPAVLLSQWLNIKRWQTSTSPQLPCPSPLSPSLFCRFSPRATSFSSSYLPCLLAPPLSLLPSPCSSSLRLPSTLLFITPGPFPRASTWSPWWLKGRPIAASCRVKVKVFHCLLLVNPSF